MKILFLNPPFKTEYGRFSRESRSPAISKSGTLYYPIWLSYAAAIAEKEGHTITIIDSPAYSYDLAKTLELIKDFKPRLVVIDTSTPSIYNDAEIADKIKNLLPGSFITLMGTHPSSLPEETLGLNKNIDACFIGEADYTLKDLAGKLKNFYSHETGTSPTSLKKLLSTIPGLAYRSKEKIFITAKRELIADLDELPFVSKIYKKYLDPKKYFFAASDYPEIQIMTSRGCTARCTFCVYPQTIHGWKYRMRSARNIADEFEWITKNMPEIREIGLEDDTFTGSQARVIEFCKILIEKKIKIKWYCNARADLKYETMVWMKKASCALLIVGYESANKKILDNIKKQTTPEMNLEFSQNARKAGLLVHGCFMAGNNGDTRESLEENLNLALKMMDDTMQFFPLIVYPGTIDFERAKKEGLITFKNYSDYVTIDGNHKSVVRMPDATSEEITKWCDYARRKYYLRPKYLFYKLCQQISHPTELRRTFKSAKRFIKYLIPK
ncbi:radical SAM domain-containing protein [Candidatus Omnitrophus magneticus]|uniref:Radical SAM domain-containing protein n=1 Tax=Candidatus Omnitrophus magneticus TaxID=1609969 RepID=A0A0F0CQM5_9BACT|nr:radical SAM domain-containing protein [Candidatus Omnitrophus magneticus]